MKANWRKKKICSELKSVDDQSNHMLATHHFAFASVG